MNVLKCNIKKIKKEIMIVILYFLNFNKLKTNKEIHNENMILKLTKYLLLYPLMSGTDVPAICIIIKRP